MTAIPKNTTPYLRTAGGGANDDPQWLGIYDAQIALTTDPLGQGRVRLYVPQVLGNTMSNWAQPMQPGIVPAVGSSCQCQFLGGNPNIPYYFMGVTDNFIAAINAGTGLVLNANPFFIGNVITPWTAVGGSLSAVQPNIDTSPPYLYAALWTASGTAGGYAADSPVTVGGGQSYQLSAWVYYPAGGMVNMGFGWNNLAGPESSTTQAFTVPADTWTPLQLTATSPADAVTGYPIIGPAASNVGDQFYVEACEMIGQIPGSLIQPGTIGVGELEENIVVAGIVDGTIVSSADFLEYNGAPAAGNLVGSWSDAGGTDSYGNTYPGGMTLQTPQQIQFLGPDGSVMSLIPAANEQITLTGLISGVYQTALSMATQDTNQVVPTHFSSVIMDAGASSQQMAALWHSPNAGTGTGILLMSESDDATLPQSILLCSVTSADDVDNLTPLAYLTPYAMVLYGTSSSQTVVTKTSGSGNIPIPPGVTTAKVECWGGGGGSIDGAGGGTPGGRGGGGGGEYACEPALPVSTAGIDYTVGAGGTGGSTGSAGGTTTARLHSSGTTVTAHGGSGPGSGETAGTGGSGSGNSIHHPGGNGGTGGSGSIGSEGNTYTYTGTPHATFSYEGGNSDSSPPPGYTPLAILNTNGQMYQGDDQLGDNGNTSTIIEWEWQTIQADIAGSTVNWIHFTITNQHSWYDSGLTLSLGYSQYAGSFGNSRNLAGWDVAEAVQTFSFTEGQKRTLNLNVSDFNMSRISAFLLYNGTSSRNYYGYFTAGSAEIQINYTTAGTYQTAGAGAGGGSSAGPLAAGNSGGNGGVTAAGAGGAAVSQGGAGGNGGAYGPDNGANGAAPGGGGGGGAYDSGSGGNGAAGQVRVTYNIGSAGPGVMFSVAAAAGTDQFGNAYPQGVFIENNTAPATPVGGPALYGNSGYLAYTSTDTLKYNTGKHRVKFGGGQSVTSSSPVGVSGSVITLADGSYGYEAWCWFTANTATYGAYIYAAGSAALSGFTGLINYTWNSGAIAYDQPTFGVNTGLFTGTLATGRAYLAYLKGYFTVSTAGTFELGAATTGGNGFTITNGIVEIEPDN